MERRFILPMVVAAVAHGALLFGFTKSPRPTPVIHPPTGCRIPVDLTWDEPDRIDVSEVEDEHVKRPATPIRPPGSPEPESVNPIERFKIPRSPTGGRVSFDAKIPPTTLPGIDSSGGGPGWTKSVLGARDLDEPPRTRFQPAPDYPFEGKREGRKGEVVVEFIVDEAGRVALPRVIRSSHRMFEEPTLRAVSRWRFEPGRRLGQVVSFKMSVPVLFTLEE